MALDSRGPCSARRRERIIKFSGAPAISESDSRVINRAPITAFSIFVSYSSITTGSRGGPGSIGIVRAGFSMHNFSTTLISLGQQHPIEFEGTPLLCLLQSERCSASVV